MKVLLVCSTSNQLVTFRRHLIEKFQTEGFQVFAIAFDEENRELLESRGVELYCVKGANRSVNPFKTIALTKAYLKIINQIKPDVVFTFMLKPNIFGTRAAKKAGVKKIFSMVEGAGDVFINKGFKWSIIRAAVCNMYRKSFEIPQHVFFLNNDDKEEFIRRKLVSEKQSIVIPGIGVDIEHFAFKPLKNYRTFLMIARMLKTKGVMEYCQAARIVKQKYPDAVFNYLGDEGTLKISDIQEYIDDGSINYLGTTKDVRPYLEDCAVYVLPSYREGMPMSVMEAEATGRAIITTNNTGCRDTVNNGENGFLFECGDYNALAEKIEWCLQNPQEVEQFGLRSRKLTEKKFDCIKINSIVLGVVINHD